MASKVTDLIFDYNGDTYIFAELPSYPRDKTDQEVKYPNSILYRIGEVCNEWIVKETIILQEKPFCCTLHEGGIFIVTPQRIILYTTNNGEQIVLRSPFDWSKLGPQSILINNNDIYIGMTGGILKITNALDQKYYFYGGDWVMSWLQNPNSLQKNLVKIPIDDILTPGYKCW